MNLISQHRKTIAAVVIGLIGWASSVVTSNKSQITAGEWVQFATVIATALGVYGVTNVSQDQ